MNLIPGTDNYSVLSSTLLNTQILTDGILTLENNIFTGIIDPITVSDAINKRYIDNIPFNLYQNITLETGLWQYVESPPISGWTYVEWGNDINKFLGITRGLIGGEQVDYLRQSYDGINWSTVSATTSATWDSIIWVPEILQYMIFSRGKDSVSFWADIYSVNDDNDWTTYTNSSSFPYSFFAIPTWSSSQKKLVIPFAHDILTFNQPSVSMDILSISIENDPFSISWTSVIISPTTPVTIFQTIWAEELELYLCTAHGDKGFISTDSLVWTTVNFTTNASWELGTWSNSLGIFVIQDTMSNLTNYSFDGVNWTSSSHSSGNYWGKPVWAQQINTMLSFLPNSIYYDYSFDGITWTTGSVGTVSANWSGSVWAPELRTIVTQSYNDLLIVTNDTYPNEVNYNAEEIINSFIKRISTTLLTDYFPSGQQIKEQIELKLPIPLVPGYSFETNVANISPDINSVITLDLQNTGLIMGNNQNPTPVIQQNSSINIISIYQGADIFKLYYTSPINFLDLSTTSNENQFKFNSRILLNENSLSVRNIFSVSEFGSITYSRDQVLNSIIDRYNTPVSDFLPLSSSLLFEGIQNDDTYTFTIRNRGSGLLTIYLNDIGIDYNNAEGIFITLNSGYSSTCVIVYNSLSNNFFAYELNRGTI